MRTRVKRKRQLPFITRHNSVIELALTILALLLIILCVIFYIIFQPERYV